MKIVILSMLTLFTLALLLTLNINTEHTNACTGNSNVSKILNVTLLSAKANSETQTTNCLSGLSECFGSGKNCAFRKRCESNCELIWVEFGDFSSCGSGSDPGEI